MADEIPAPAHEDFAEVALRITKTPMEDGDQIPPAPKKESAQPGKKEEPAPKKDAGARAFPAELFGKPSEQKKDEIPTIKSELDEIEQPVFKDPARKAQWDKLHGKAAELEKKKQEAEAKVADMEKRIAEAEARGTDTATLQKRLEEAERKYNESMELVRKVNVELDPAFNDKFVKGRASLVKDISKTVSDAGGDPDSMTVALNLSGSERVKAIASAIQDLPVYIQGIIGRKIDSLTALDDEASTHRSSPEQYLTQRQQDEQQRTAREQQEAARNANLAFDSALKKSSELEVLNEVKELDWWNEQRRAILDNARKFYDSPPSQEAIARRCLEGEAMPIYRQLFLDQRKANEEANAKIAELEKELKNIHSRSPQLGGRGNGSIDRSNMTFADVARGLIDGSIPVSGRSDE